MRHVRALAVAFAGLLFAGPALAQGKWAKLAPFPEPSEELLGASAGGKMYVFAGLAPGWVPKALVYEYDPATDKWAKKKPMALPSHHIAFTEHKGKIYAFGGFVPSRVKTFMQAAERVRKTQAQADANSKKGK